MSEEQVRRPVVARSTWAASIARLIRCAQPRIYFRAMQSRAFLSVLAMFLIVVPAGGGFAQPTTPPPQTQPAADSEDGREPVAGRLRSGMISVGTIVSDDDDPIVIYAAPLGTLTLKTAEVAGRVAPALVEKV